MFTWLYYLLGYDDKNITTEVETKMLYKESRFCILPRDKDTDLFDGPFRYC